MIRFTSLSSFHRMVLLHPVCLAADSVVWLPIICPVTYVWSDEWVGGHDQLLVWFAGEWNWLPSAFNILFACCVWKALSWLCVCRKQPCVTAGTDSHSSCLHDVPCLPTRWLYYYQSSVNLLGRFSFVYFVVYDIILLYVKSCPEGI